VVDPQLEIEPYLEAAAQKSMRITHIFETHVQADHLSGARRLADATGAPVIFHKSAPVGFPHVDVADGEQHDLGNVSLSILHTPGHTPDSVSILVTDKTRAPEPWFVLTGDTLFSGGVGRPDLIGAGSETTFAEQLHESLHGRILTLPDHVEVFPAHFGVERRFNPALRLTSKSEFVQFVLADLPPQPESFAENRRRNLSGE